MTSPAEGQGRPSDTRRRAVSALVGATAAASLLAIAVPAAYAEPDSTTTTVTPSTTTTSTMTSTTTSTTAPSSPVTQYSTDDQGFVDSAARCDRSQTVVAMARTESALVVICSDGGINYQYRGVRVSDGALLKVPATPRSRGGFVAENDGVEYTISPDELVVTANDEEIRREPVLVYVQPNTGSYPAEEPPPTQEPG